MDEVEESKLFISNKHKEINLSFIGAVRHLSIDKKIADLFGNDPSYKVFYNGNGISFEALMDYTKDKYDNFFLTGKYNRRDKLKLLKDATIILSYYSSDNYANKFALPNKYYDALIYKIPLWANPDVYVGRRAIEAGIGLNIVLDRTSPDAILNVLSKFDLKKFEDNCTKELSRILKEDENFIKKLHHFIKM